MGGPHSERHSAVRTGLEGVRLVRPRPPQQHHLVPGHRLSRMLRLQRRPRWRPLPGMSRRLGAGHFLSSFFLSFFVSFFLSFLPSSSSSSSKSYITTAVISCVTVLAKLLPHLTSIVINFGAALNCRSSSEANPKHWLTRYCLQPLP